MKNRERIIWISTVSVLFVVLLFGVFVNDAKGASVTSGFQYIQKFLNVMEMVKKEYVDESKIDNEKLINGAIKGMIDSIGDPHTNYLSKEDMDEMNQTSDGKFGGVGMIISEKDDYITVVTPIEDTPAFRKGMKSGDMLISVDGKSLRSVKVSEAAKMLKGTPGTSVKVEFIRNEIKYEVEFVRAIIDVPTVKYSYIKDKYGYLRITQFAGTTDGYVKKALSEFKDKNIKGMIVDLRSNPGGLLGQVIKIVDFFQDDGIIVSTKGRSNFDNSVSKANKFDTLVANDIPVIILIDQGSASASEIFSGALKDNKRAILIGEKSYGKGSVQTIKRLDYDGYKITIAKYYTPSGVCIDGIGIEPDIAIKEPELNDDEKDSLRKLYKDKIIDEYVKKNPHPTIEQINEEIKIIQKKGYSLSDRHLKKLLKNAIELTEDTKIVYDLEYDIQLQKAVEVLDNNLLEFKDGTFILKK
ncbi:MAG TPA: S41 family peptidase [Spirochaetota bacterium]|nr:S41 family peptidase [Spirochaetota bacterium]